MGMGIKLKALGLGLLVALATAGFAVVSASATVSGHFESDVEHTTIVGTENGAPHDTVLREEGSSGAGITCTHAHYHGTVIPKTTQSLTVTQTYTGCATSSSTNWGEIKVHTNGCAYTLYSHGVNTHGTVTIECPAGKAIEITHPNCTITVPEQHPGATLTGGITYTTNVEGGKHTLTASVTLKQITMHFHAGICIFLGTSHKFEMNGAFTVEGKNTAGERVNVTHT